MIPDYPFEISPLFRVLRVFRGSSKGATGKPRIGRHFEARVAEFAASKLYRETRNIFLTFFIERTEVAITLKAVGWNEERVREANCELKIYPHRLIRNSKVRYLRPITVKIAIVPHAPLILNLD